MRFLLEQPLLHQTGCVVQHREIENFYLGLDSVLQHGPRQAFDKLGRVLVNIGRKVDRAGGKRRHVRPQVEHRASRGLIAAATAGRELDDHSGAMLAHALLHGTVERRIGRRRFIGIAHVDVHERRSGFESIVRRFDLLGGRDGNGRVVLLARQRAGDGNGDDDAS